MSKSKDERRHKILEITAREGRISVADICTTFGVSSMTARRDLRDLDKNGLLRRVHGGAISALGRSYEPSYSLRSSRRQNVKKAIGHKAAELVLDGDSIALDVGTTTIDIVKSLRNKQNLTILTASLHIAHEVANELSLSTNVRLIVTGGIVRPGELSMVGNIAESAYKEFHVDKAFIGIGGISIEGGLTEYNLEDALVKQALISSARHSVIVSDSSKFGRTTFASIGPLSSVDTIVTDSGVPKDMLHSLRERGLKVVLVDVDRDAERTG